jgi:hypothetical protein
MESHDFVAIQDEESSVESKSFKKDVVNPYFKDIFKVVLFL